MSHSPQSCPQAAPGGSPRASSPGPGAAPEQAPRPLGLAFTKMHGNGNDFVLLDDRAGTLELTPDRLRRLSDRRLGVGCDQILVARRPRGDAALAMAIFNADGSAAGQCGNGLRCFAVYARDQAMVSAGRFTVETPGGLVDVELLPGGDVRAAMGRPRLEPAEIPMTPRPRAASYDLEVAGETVSVGAVSMGNPHAVLWVDDLDAAPVTRLGPSIQALPDFPEGVNVGFAQVLSRRQIRLRVFERGVGETLACGSGACAAVVVGRLQQRLEPRVRVSLPGGDLDIAWPGEDAEVVMTGPTARAFTGETTI